jgi:hypothetical protein
MFAFGLIFRLMELEGLQVQWSTQSDQDSHFVR